MTDTRANAMPAITRSVGAFKLADLGWLLVFNLLMFQAPIQNATGFTYIDESATLIAIAAYTIERLRSSGNNDKAGILASRCLLCLGLVVAVGLLSNLFSGVSAAASSIAIDMFTCIKFPVALICITLVFRNKTQLLRAVEGECKALVAVLLFFGVLNLFVQIGDFGVDPRYGIRSFRFIFIHPEMLNFVCVGILLILAQDYRKNMKWIIATLFIICLSLRSKGIAFAAIALLLMLTWGRGGRLNLAQIAVGAVAAFAIGWDQYKYYFKSTGFARSELNRVAVVLANRFFPLGSGFATYGSSITSGLSNYSPLYYEYGLSTVYGLEPGQTAFLSDTFWPIVIGQFGWLGFVMYCLTIGFLCRWAYNFASSKGQRLAVVLCFVFLLISSTAESAFFHPNAIFLAMCLGLALAGGHSSPEAA